MIAQQQEIKSREKYFFRATIGTSIADTLSNLIKGDNELSFNDELLLNNDFERVNVSIRYTSYLSVPNTLGSHAYINVVPKVCDFSSRPLFLNGFEDRSIYTASFETVFNDILRRITVSKVWVNYCVDLMSLNTTSVFNAGTSATLHNVFSIKVESI